MSYGLRFNPEIVPSKRTITGNPFFIEPTSYLHLREDKGLKLPKNKTILVIGTSPEFKEDIDKFNNMFPDLEYDIFAVNKAGVYVDEIDHWGTLHSEKLPESFMLQREEAGFSLNNFKTHSYIKTLTKRREGAAEYVDYTWDVPCIHGSSGLFCVSLSYIMGYEHAVCVGIGLSGTYRAYLNYWRGWYSAFKGFAFSMSGLSEELLGKPLEGSLE